MTAPRLQKYTNNPQAAEPDNFTFWLWSMNENIGEKLQSLGNTCFLTCSLPRSLLKSICWNLFKALAFPPRVGSSPFVAVRFMFFSVGSSVFTFPRRVLDRARRLYVIFYSTETLAWCVYMYAQMHGWRPEVNTGGLTLSPYSLRCSLPEPGADSLDWLATELCDTLVSIPAALGLLLYAAVSSLLHECSGSKFRSHHCTTHLTSWAISLVPCTPCFGLRFVLLLIMCVGGICTCECSTHMGQKRALYYLQLELQWPMSWEDPDPLQEQYVLWVVPVLLSSQAPSIPFENSSTVSLHPHI